MGEITEIEKLEHAAEFLHRAGTNISKLIRCVHLAACLPDVPEIEKQAVQVDACTPPASEDVRVDKLTQTKGVIEELRKSILQVVKSTCTFLDSPKVAAIPKNPGVHYANRGESIPGHVRARYMKPTVNTKEDRKSGFDLDLCLQELREADSQCS